MVLVNIYLLLNITGIRFTKFRVYRSSTASIHAQKLIFQYVLKNLNFELQFNESPAVHPQSIEHLDPALVGRIQDIVDTTEPGVIGDRR